MMESVLNATPQETQKDPLETYHPKPISFSSQFQNANFQLGIGLFALAIGLYPLLALLGYVPASVEKWLPVGQANAPMWLITMILGLFSGLGAVIFIQGIIRKFDQRIRARRKLDQPGQPWYWDYRWDRTGAESRFKATWLAHLSGATLVVVFNAVAFWVGWGADGPGIMFPFVGILVFDCLVLARFRAMLAKRIKFGTTTVEFHTFPFRLGSELNISLRNLPSGSGVHSMQAMLVHAKYDFEKTKQMNRKSNSSVELCVSKLYSDSKRISLDQINSNGRLDMSWQVPDNPQWQSDLSNSDCAFWELVIHVEQDGADYHDSFLLPIY